jgi:peroxiredoxin family protein
MFDSFDDRGMYAVVLIACSLTMKLFGVILRCEAHILTNIETASRLE